MPNPRSASSQMQRACVDSLESRRLFAAAVVGYLPDYESAGTFPTKLKNAGYEGLTQIDYFSVLPTTAGLLPGTSVNGVSNTSTQTSGGYALSGSSAQLTKLVTDAHASGVKVVVVVGGGGSYSNNLGSVVKAGATAWETFATSAQQFAAAHNIDGFDLDWEPSSLTATDTTSYGGMIAALRQANPNLILTSAVNSEKLPVTGRANAYILNAAAMSNLSAINVMAYDLEAGNVSPIGHAETALDGWGSYATANGVSKSKLTFGMPFYGTSGTTWANTQAKQYVELMTLAKSQNGALPAPAADNVTLAGVVWNYNGPTTIGTKTAYAVSGGYGGICIWEVGQDYFNPNTGAYDDTYSLLPAVKRATTPVLATISGGVLTINTAVTGSTVSLNDNGTLTISASGVVNQFADNLFTRIVFLGTGSADSLTLNSTINSPITYTGGGGADTLNVNAGTFNASTDLGLSNANLALNVSSGAKAIFASTEHLASLSVNGTASLASNGNLVLSVANLTLGENGVLDVANNNVVIDYTDSSPQAAVLGLLKAGRNGGTWDGAHGIVSSAISATAASTLGLGEAASILGDTGGTFAGQTVDNTSLLIRFTVFGDVNLDRKVDIVDLGRLAGHWHQSANFSDGDLNYDDTVDIIDLGQLSGNWQRELTFPALAIETPAKVTVVAPKKGKGLN